MEARSLPSSAQPKIDNNKLSAIDTSDTKGESETRLCNESMNMTTSGVEENDELGLDEKEYRTERAVSPKVRKTEITCNKEEKLECVGVTAKDQEGLE